MILPVPVGFNSGAISMVLTGLGWFRSETGVAGALGAHLPLENRQPLINPDYEVLYSPECRVPISAIGITAASLDAGRFRCDHRDADRRLRDDPDGTRLREPP